MRSLVDATALPENRVGSAAMSTRSSSGCRPRCRRARRRPAPRTCPLRAVASARTTSTSRPGWAAPAGPAGLGADRPSAGRPPRRADVLALAALHDAAARPASPVGRDAARRHVLHRAGHAHAVKARVLPGLDADRAAPRRPAASCRRGDPRRGGARSPTPTRPHRRRLPRGRPRRSSTRPTDAEQAPGARPARPARRAVRRLPRHAGAAQERARADPRLGPGRAPTRPTPPALVLAGGAGWDDEIDAGNGRGADADLRVLRPGYLPLRRSARVPRRRRRSSRTRRTARASACRCWRRWPAAPRC